MIKRCLNITSFRAAAKTIRQRNKQTYTQNQTKIQTKNTHISVVYAPPHLHTLSQITSANLSNKQKEEEREENEIQMIYPNCSSFWILRCSLYLDPTMLEPTPTLSPWHNRTGWLGVEHQVSKLLPPPPPSRKQTKKERKREKKWRHQKPPPISRVCGVVETWIQLSFI